MHLIVTLIMFLWLLINRWETFDNIVVDRGKYIAFKQFDLLSNDICNI